MELGFFQQMFIPRLFYDKMRSTEQSNVCFVKNYRAKTNLKNSVEISEPDMM